MQILEIGCWIIAAYCAVMLVMILVFKWREGV
jgi:hypothetical protein